MTILESIRQLPNSVTYKFVKGQRDIAVGDHTTPYKTLVAEIQGQPRLKGTIMRAGALVLWRRSSKNGDGSKQELEETIRNARRRWADYEHHERRF
ncbi:hypothetical protein HYS97_00470 [Candidatus Daviesbacteria bacterium]|nr:hypothetical protein [Candidatus Daviesbacteria bacterium]